MLVKSVTIVRGLSVLLGVAAAAVALPSVAQQPKTEIGFLWHMHQPLYYPGESITQTQAAGRFSFSLYDVHNQRFGPYTSWPKNAVVNGSVLPNLGASVSFSGTLVKNLNDLQAAGVNGGMWNNWTQSYRDARALKTQRNNARLDLIGFTWGHALAPLLDERDIRMQIKLHKQVTQNTFGSGVAYSKGFFPAETAFSERMIPWLKAEGFDWTLYDNIHLDRATKNYPHTNATGMFAPNKAEQINADPATTGGAWVQLNNLWAPSKVSAPNSYRPAWAQYVNPNTGVVDKIIAVPAARYEGNEDGRGGFGALLYQQVMDQYRQYNTDPVRPLLVVLHHDGDNFGGGSESYYNSNFSSMINWARNNPSYNVTSIQDYVDRFPVPQGAVVKIANGSWAGADNGDPEFKKWLGDPNGAGWSPDRNSWAVLTAAKNRVYTAEDIAPVSSLNNVLNNTGNAAERAWHYLVQAQSSDHWYWDGTEIWDSNVTRGSNLAVSAAAAALTAANLANERTAPSVFIPQRSIYNPGEKEFGTTAESADFSVWTYAYDVSGLTSVQLKYRIDADGQNPLESTQNETYAGGSEVGGWQSLAMTNTDVAPPAGILPATYRAMQYTAPVTGLRNVMIDYYVEAVDAKGNVTKTDIQQVWIGSGPTTPPPPPAGSFVMDGTLDAGAGVVASNAGMSLHAAVSDGKLYVAAPDAGEGADHFIFVALAPGAMRASPWAKAGQVAGWDAFLADENVNDYEGWFDASGTTAAATGGNGGVLEGWLDLVGELGTYPESIYLAVGAYNNPDGGQLLPGTQVPAGNGDLNIQATEYVKYNLPQPEWGGLVAGVWSAKGNWVLSTVPNGAGMTARLLGRPAGQAVITLDQSITLNRLELGGAGYSVTSGGGAGSLTFAGTSTRLIDVQAGSHVLDVVLVLNKSGEFAVGPGASLLLARGLESPLRSVNKTGDGLLELASMKLSALSITGGVVRLGGDGVSQVAGLQLAGGALDLGRSDMLIDYAGPSPIAGLIAAYRAGMLQARADDGAGLPTFLAMAEAAELGVTDFRGIVVDATAVMLKYTYVGDANLDGQVDALDYERIDLAVGNAGVFGTAQGDLNYDGNVDALDYEQVDLNIGNGVGSPLGGNGVGRGVGVVFIPEPAAMSLLAVVVMGGCRRR